MTFDVAHLHHDIHHAPILDKFDLFDCFWRICLLDLGGVRFVFASLGEDLDPLIRRWVCLEPGNMTFIHLPRCHDTFCILAIKVFYVERWPIYSCKLSLGNICTINMRSKLSEIAPHRASPLYQRLLVRLILNSFKPRIGIDALDTNAMS